MYEAFSRSAHFLDADMQELAMILNQNYVLYGQNSNSAWVTMQLADSVQVVRQEDPYLNTFLAALKPGDDGDDGTVSSDWMCGENLELASQNLSGVPRWMFTGAFEQVKKINLEDNLLSSLPRSDGSLRKVEVLLLGRNRFKIVPYHVCSFQNTLVTLALECNLLESIPHWINDMMCLRTLNLSRNRLRHFPVISGLVSLESFNISENYIRNLRCTTRLPSLWQVEVSQNPLEVLSRNLVAQTRSFTGSRTLLSELPRMYSLMSLTICGGALVSIGKLGWSIGLIHLALESNEISVFPKEICVLDALESLDLSANYICRVPAEIGDLKSLKILRLSHNSIRGFPASVCNLTKLEVLTADNNCLTSLPSRLGYLRLLRSLSVETNKLRSLPRSLTQSNSLRLLRIQNNPLDYVRHNALVRNKVQVYRI